MVDTQPTTTMSVSTTTRYMLQSFHECAIQDVKIKMVVGADVPAPEKVGKFLMKQIMEFDLHEANFKGVMMALKLNGAGIKASLKNTE